MKKKAVFHNPNTITVGQGREKIDEKEYAGNRRLARIEIAKGVNEICSCAFRGCVNLEYVKIPKSVTWIGEKAFEGCSRLTALIVENRKALREIWKAVPGCGKLPAIVEGRTLYYAPIKDGRAIIPPGVTRIADSTFADNKQLLRVSIPTGVRHIGCDAFAGCSRLISVVLPETLSKIEWDAFSGCKALKYIDLPQSLKELGCGAFRNCCKLKLVEIPRSIKEVSGGCFCNCSGLTSAILPKVKVIGGCAFEGCSKLTEVSLPSTLEELDYYAFKDCLKLERIVAADATLKKIDMSFAFAGCHRLRDSIVVGGVLKFMPEEGESLTIPEGVVEIPRGLFLGRTRLKEIVFPSTLRKIGYEAFKGCFGLRRVSFGSGDTAIESDAFKWCVGVCDVVYAKDAARDCALFASDEYREMVKTASRNLKFGNADTLKVARLELYSYAVSVGFSARNSLREISRDGAMEAVAESDFRGLDVGLGDVAGQLVYANGKEVRVNVKKCLRINAGRVNSWSQYRDKLGIYAVDIDKDCIEAYVAFVGKFDPSKISFRYRKAISPGYYMFPDRDICLLESILYDGMKLDYEYSCEPNPKGTVFTVLNHGRYAELQDDMTDAEWGNYP